jgi:PPM family protein phosphatase
MEKLFEFIKQNAVLCSIDFAVIAACLIAIVITLRKILKKDTSSLGIGSAIHIGTRQYQQDSYFIPDSVPLQVLKRKGCLCVLCDGMGGLDGGEDASRLCTESLSYAYYYKNETTNIYDFFEGEINGLDEKVSRLEDRSGNKIRAGTTIVCALIKDNRLYWASAGDSRIYLVRGDNIMQLTRDHNYALSLARDVRNGLITEEEAEADPEKDSLISYVGMNGLEILDINAKGLSLQKGDTVLLSSDGLFRTLSEDEIAFIIKENQNDMELAAHILIAKAFDKNKPYQDNMSAVLMAYK